MLLTRHQNHLIITNSGEEIVPEVADCYLRVGDGHPWAPSIEDGSDELSLIFIDFFHENLLRDEPMVIEINPTGEVIEVPTEAWNKIVIERGHYDA